MDRDREAFEAGAMEMKRRFVSAMGVWLKARRNAGPIQPEEIDGLIVDFKICPLPEFVSPPEKEPPALRSWMDKRSLGWLRILRDNGPAEAPLGTPIAAMCEGAGWVERSERKFRITDAGRRALAEHEEG